MDVKALTDEQLNEAMRAEIRSGDHERLTAILAEKNERRRNEAMTDFLLTMRRHASQA